MYSVLLLFYWANNGIWTHDLFLTKEVLYPWATSADVLVHWFFLLNSSSVFAAWHKWTNEPNNQWTIRAEDEVRTRDL